MHFSPSGPSDLVETPPTPFADRLLEQELIRAKREEQVITRNATANFNDRHPTSLASASAMYPLSDIESFIAKVTVPPPPDETPQLTAKDLQNSSQDFSGKNHIISNPRGKNQCLTARKEKIASKTKQVIQGKEM